MSWVLSEVRIFRNKHLNLFRPTFVPINPVNLTCLSIRILPVFNAMFNFNEFIFDLRVYHFIDIFSN